MDAATRELVRRGAEHRCEYCLLPQSCSVLPHHIEHITAKQHRGSDDPGNLALARHRCNLQKGPNLTAIDPLTNEVAPLFHPRHDEWAGHFRFRGVYIEGVTAAGGRRSGYSPSMMPAGWSSEPNC